MTRSERRFLRVLADELDLDDPLPLFIEPSYFTTSLENEHLTAHRKTILYMLKKLYDIRLEAYPADDENETGILSVTQVVSRSKA